VQLPFDREKLRRRNLADRDDERLAAAARSPADGLRDTLEVSEVVRSLARATLGEPSATDDLAEKARLYARPLRAAQGR
jgi:hypothetical protein